MSANIYIIEDYENEPPSGSKKTKPKQTQFKPNSNPIKACFFLDLLIKELIVIFYKDVIIRNSLKKIIILKGY